MSRWSRNQSGEGTGGSALGANKTQTQDVTQTGKKKKTLSKDMGEISTLENTEVELNTIASGTDITTIGDETIWCRSGDESRVEWQR